MRPNGFAQQLGVTLKEVILCRRQHYRRRIISESKQIRRTFCCSQWEPLRIGGGKYCGSRLQIWNLSFRFSQHGQQRVTLQSHRLYNRKAKNGDAQYARINLQNKTLFTNLVKRHALDEKNSSC